jgi:peptide/nickel transport system permease protein
MKAIRGCAIVFLTLVGTAAIAPEWWTRTRYDTQFRDQPDAPPSRAFPLGTDALGRDRWARLWYGTRISLTLAPAAALLSCAAAALAGGGAGWMGGFLDGALQTASDLFLSLPWFFLLLMVRAFLPLNAAPLASVALTFALVGALGWAAPARVVCAAVRRIKTSDFFFQAQAAGCRAARVLWRQLLPNVAPVLWAQFWVAVPAYILAEATLGMLGLGIAEPLPSWGGMLRELEGVPSFQQWWLFAPAVLLAAVVASLQAILSRKEDSV